MKSKSKQIKSLKQSIKSTSSKNMRDSLKLKVDILEKNENKKLNKISTKKVSKNISKKPNLIELINSIDWAKMNILFNETRDVKLNIHGFPLFVKSDSFIIRFIESEHKNIVVMQTTYQSGLVEEVPINCVDLFGCTPKQFIDEFEKQNYKNIIKEKKIRAKELVRQGYKEVRF